MPACGQTGLIACMREFNGSVIRMGEPWKLVFVSSTLDIVKMGLHFH